MPFVINNGGSWLFGPPDSLGVNTPYPEFGLPNEYLPDPADDAEKAPCKQPGDTDDRRLDLLPDLED